MQDFGRRADRGEARPRVRPLPPADHPGVVEPAHREAAIALPQLLGVVALGAAVLYFSLKGGWRAGSIMGLALVVLPLIEAMIPGFVAKFTSGVEQVQRLVYTVGAVVVVAAIAVLAWTGLSQPKRPERVARPVAQDAMRKVPSAQPARTGDGDRPQFFKQGRPMPSDGPGSELYVRRLQ